MNPTNVTGRRARRSTFATALAVGLLAPASILHHVSRPGDSTWLVVHLAQPLLHACVAASIILSLRRIRGGIATAARVCAGAFALIWIIYDAAAGLGAHAVVAAATGGEVAAARELAGRMTGAGSSLAPLALGGGACLVAALVLASTSVWRVGAPTSSAIAIAAALPAGVLAGAAVGSTTHGGPVAWALLAASLVALEARWRRGMP